MFRLALLYVTHRCDHCILANHQHDAYLDHDVSNVQLQFLLLRFVIMWFNQSTM